MTIEVKIIVGSTTALETNIFEIPYPITIFKIYAYSVSNYGVFVIRDSELPAFPIEAIAIDSKGISQRITLGNKADRHVLRQLALVIIVHLPQDHCRSF